MTEELKKQFYKEFITYAENDGSDITHCATDKLWGWIENNFTPKGKLLDKLPHERVVKPTLADFNKLEQLLIERDGGACDSDCKTNYGRGCNCGHMAVSEYLSKCSL